VSLFLFKACMPPENTNDNTPKNSVAENITPTPNIEITEFEKELKSMQVAGFDYIFTLKRKDGSVFTREDRAFVRENKHYAANRFTFVEDDKVLFVGSNYRFADEKIMALKKRFEFGNYSKPDEQIAKEKEVKKKEREEAAENTNSNSGNSSESSNKE